MRNRFFDYDRRSIVYGQRLIQNARVADQFYFAGAHACCDLPRLHRGADMRGGMLPRSLARSQLLSSDNPFGMGLSNYI